MIVFLAAAAALVAAATLAIGVRRHGVRLALFSPLTLVALLLVGHAGLRPLVLRSDPEAATMGVWMLGWSSDALTQASVILLVGFGLFGIAFALASRGAVSRGGGTAPVSGVRCLVVAAVGCLLWGALFLRLGGPRALIENPASLKTGQFGGSYGLVGLAACTGATLLAFHEWLRQPTRRMLAIVVACSLTTVAGSVCLATRSPILITVLAGLLLLGRWRRLRPRQTIAVAITLLVVVTGVQILRQVREFAQFGSVSQAVSTTLRTGPLTVVSADLIEYDHLVALVQLVPDPLPRLRGESLAAVPQAFVPRALWSEKPRPVDYELSTVLYGPTTSAGTPFTLPGELWWNFGWLGVLLGAPALGFAAGSAWWRWSGGDGVLTVAAVVAGAYAYILLTRPWAAMTMTTFIGVGTVILIGVRPAAVVASARRTLRPLAGGASGAVAGTVAADSQEEA